ncbi:MAG: hypothetical protein K9K66_15565 [Desulfarculaceae bacterium]|nr:hypothetical protein [Desulfarculaceae bacterium]MCF8073552.1 hypothetical protein [Desulfarculaceae bacterium]MCF8103074.1 hypothetical protein [Desulfarculaceae bacterium]MCF8115732.1 hypothetical protein [Desulfarculaceae bacterium]
MRSRNDPEIAKQHAVLQQAIIAQGVKAWLSEKAQPASLDSLIYLCKFAFFTGILTKSQIGQVLGADRPEVKALVRGWYDDHRARGCGTC